MGEEGFRGFLPALYRGPSPFSCKVKGTERPEQGIFVLSISCPNFWVSQREAVFREGFCSWLSLGLGIPDASTDIVGHVRQKGVIHGFRINLNAKISFELSTV